MAYSIRNRVNRTLGLNENFDDNNSRLRNRVNTVFGQAETPVTTNTSTSTVTSGAVKKFNPFLKRDGSLINPFADYQPVLDNANVNSRVKQWITEATGKTPSALQNGTSTSANAVSDGETSVNSNAVSDGEISFNGDYDNSRLGDLDIATELPKLTTNQISAIIGKHFANSSVISPSDAQGIYNAQKTTGMSALAILGIGALESGWGTSNIAKKTNNIWGYGATNINPEGNAHRYSQMSDGASQFASEFMKTYYNGYGAKSINSAGTGNNPKGMGYAYTDSGAIDTSWAAQVDNIMGTLYNTAKSVGGGSTSAQTTGTSGSTAGTSKGQALVNAAKQYIGVPYVWGGTSAKGVDCSGLVQLAAKAVGIDIPRVTYDQINVGKAVDKNNLQPGDLVFFKGSDGTYQSPGHVGMYVGNGQFIQAPKTGDVVKISNLADRGDYVGARRIV